MIAYHRARGIEFISELSKDDLDDEDDDSSDEDSTAEKTEDNSLAANAF